MTSPPAETGRTSVPRTRISVVHLVTTLNIGGLERVVLDLVRWRTAATFDAHVIILDASGVVEEPLLALGVPVEAIGTNGSVPARIVRLARRLRVLNPDIVHTHNPQAHLHGTWAARMAGVPAVVHSRHGRGTARRGAVSMLSRLAWRWTSSVVAVSEDAARVLRDADGAPTTRLIVIHNGIDVAHHSVTRAGVQPLSPRAVTVGRLDPVKDLATMLRAVSEVVDVIPAFSLDIVGDGPSRRELEHLRDDLGLGGRVRFVGFQKDVRPFLAAASLFVQSSLSEGLPLALLEAMASGLPVVATDVGGVREVVVEGETGYLAPAGSPGALAACIRRVLLEPESMVRLGSAGRKRVEARFNISRVAIRYESVYLEALAEFNATGRDRG
jgi:glycosyltransferase involved in cell wall biosynthesis